MSQPVLTTAELTRRKLVWDALSDLFLDSEIRDELPRNALRLAESGYADIEIEAIFLDEVSPILHWNLKSTSGICGGFEENWVSEQILRRRRPEPMPRAISRIARWVSRVRAWPVLHEFEVLLALVGRARSLAEAERSAWADALGGLAALYFEKPTAHSLVEARVAQVTNAAQAERRRADLRHVRGPRNRTRTGPHGDQSQPGRTHAVRMEFLRPAGNKAETARSRPVRVRSRRSARRASAAVAQRRRRGGWQRAAVRVAGFRAIQVAAFRG